MQHFDATRSARLRRLNIAFALLAMSLAACGGGDDDPAPVSSTPTPAPAPAPAPAPEPVGVSNRCFDPAYFALPVGLAYNVVYAVSGSGGTGELTIDTKIDGPTTFEGLSRTQTTTKIDSSLTDGGTTITSATEAKDYQTSDGTLITSYGELSTGTITFPGIGVTNSASKEVDTPPYIDRIHTLTLGGSITQTETSLITVTLPSPSGPTTSTMTSTTKYVSDETLVVSGKPYATCRYEVFDTSAPLDVTTLWYIVGKGIPAQVTNTAGTTVLQIKSGTYKDAPL